MFSFQSLLFGFLYSTTPPIFPRPPPSPPKKTSNHFTLAFTNYSNQINHLPILKKKRGRKEEMEKKGGFNLYLKIEELLVLVFF